MRNREKKEKQCLNCGNSIPNMNVYCNNSCQAEYQNNKVISEWLNGENKLIGGGSVIPRWMRKYLLDEANHQCSECGWGEINPYTGTTPLDVDHVDGDATNNLKENLRVLCPNCHSLKKTFKNTGRRKSTRTYRTQ